MNVSFYDWVEDASLGGKFEMGLGDAGATCEYLTRFNLEIAELIQRYGEEAIDKAIWHRYGLAGGDARDATDPSLGRARLDFMESVKSLYADGFSKYCSNYFSHLDRGPELPRPLNGSCYMLWDMDGIECRAAYDGDQEMLELSLNVLEYALAMEHVACQESALHGLGHLAFEHRERVSPILHHKYLQSREVLPELKEYARCAAQGYVE